MSWERKKLKVKQLGIEEEEEDMMSRHLDAVATSACKEKEVATTSAQERRSRHQLKVATSVVKTMSRHHLVVVTVIALKRRSRQHSVVATTIPQKRKSRHPL